MNHIFNEIGIYLNQPEGKLLKIIYNKKDADKVKDKNKILKVNEENVKFGKSKNLNARYMEYKKIFGKNTNFKKIILINDYEKLINFENHLKKVFKKFCLRSLQMEFKWNGCIIFLY